MGRKTDADPAGQRTNRGRAAAVLRRRLRAAQAGVLRLFRAIPAHVRNADEPVWVYDDSPQAMSEFYLAVQAEIARQLGVDADRLPAAWPLAGLAELPYRQGTVEAVVDSSKLVRDAARRAIEGRGGLPLREPSADVILDSRAYRDNVQRAQIRLHQALRGLSADTARSVMQVVQSGVDGGRGPLEITRGIRERFDVSVTSARRIASTETQWGYNKARLDGIDMSAEQSGLTMRVEHQSALLPTTRPDHAARHGNVYTTDEQRAWWNEGANMINCKCYTLPVVDDD